MTSVALSIQVEGAQDLVPARLHGVERLGEASTFEIDLLGPKDAPVTPRDVLRKPGRIVLESATGRRAIAGVVTRFVVIAGDHEHRRRYRLTLSSGFALLALRRRARGFQALTAPEIIAQVMNEGGYPDVQTRLFTRHPKRRYVVQYQETDAAFVRRIAEEHGLFFRFEPTENGEAFILEDDSTAADTPSPGGLLLVARSPFNEPVPIATNASRLRRREAGKVTLRDHDEDRPDLALDGEAQDGLLAEQELERYEAPGDFDSPDEGERRARLLLQARRAEASRLSFDTNAVAIAPGLSLRLIDDPAHPIGLRAEGEHVAIAVITRWDAAAGVLRAAVEAIPRDVPYRLPRVTPRPRIPGVQSAWVTGAKGEEIHPDGLGRVHVRFHWDLHAAADHHSSPPIRVLQSHLPGPMIIPRVGWEVFVMFEDGDPERPYVIGRSYNQKQPPPLPLPANKTVTSLATDSSPGRGARTVIQMDDAAGKEHLLIHAPASMNQNVAGNQAVQTLKNEDLQVDADRSDRIGATEAISVHLGAMGGYGARSVVVGAAQYQSAGGNFISEVSAEQAIVGGMLVEHAGNPVKGVANLAVSHSLSAASASGVDGQVSAAVAGALRAACEGYEARGEEGALSAEKDSAVGSAMALLPGGDAIFAAVKGSSTPMPWDHGRPDGGDRAPGGGASGASGADSGAAGPGPGHRSVVASASYTEAIGALYALVTPGPVSWVTAGASMTLIRGSHTEKAASAGLRVGGGLGEWQGALFINSRGFLERKVKGSMKSSVDGALNITAGSDYILSARSALTFKVNGSLLFQGDPITFRCGASSISATSAGVKIASPTITITGRSKQSGSLTHK